MKRISLNIVVKKVKQLFYSFLIMNMCLLAGCDKDEDETSLIGTKLENYELTMVVNYPFPVTNKSPFEFDHLLLEKINNNSLCTGRLFYRDFIFQIDEETLTDLIKDYPSRKEEIETGSKHLTGYSLDVTISGRFIKSQKPAISKVNFIIESIISKEEL